MQILELIRAPLSTLNEAEKGVRFSAYKTCIVCSKQFKARRYDARLCSATCRSRLYRDRKAEQLAKQNQVNEAGAENEDRP